jgi:CheY-like chemotaxis protein
VALILIADDELAIAEVIGMFLQSEGHRVVVTGNGMEALTRAIHETPDLIITDVMMPVLDGLALCRTVQRDPRLQRTPIILMSATREIHDEECRALALLHKPFEIPDLLELVNRALTVERGNRRA